MHKIIHYSEYESFVDPSEADLIIKSKFRGIDPWVISNGKRVRMTSIDVLAAEYQIAKEDGQRMGHQVKRRGFSPDIIRWKLKGGPHLFINPFYSNSI